MWQPADTINLLWAASSMIGALSGLVIAVRQQRTHVDLAQIKAATNGTLSTAQAGLEASRASLSRMSELHDAAIQTLLTPPASPVPAVVETKP